MTEAALVRQVIDLNNKAGRKAIKIHGNQYTEAGTPDILISGFETVNNVGVPVPIFIEAKIKDNLPEQVQILRLIQWGNSGFWTAVIWSVQDYHNFYSAVLARLGSKPYFMGFFKHGRAMATPEIYSKFYPEQEELYSRLTYGIR